MYKKILKGAFFGYSKLSVCEYIADMNEQFRNKILDMEENHKKEIEELHKKLSACEAELAEYKRHHEDVSAVLIDAQRYAASVKAKAQQDFEKVIEENENRKALLAQRIKLYTTAVGSLKNHIAQILKNVDNELSEIVAKATDIKEELEEA